MPKQYTDEFKQQLIDLHLCGGRSLTNISQDYKLGHSTLIRWVTEAKKHNGLLKPILSPAEIELLELQKKYKRLKLENEILKQAALILGKK